MKRNLVSLVIASALLAATPGLVFAQAARAQKSATVQGSPSQLVLWSSADLA